MEIKQQHGVIICDRETGKIRDVQVWETLEELVAEVQGNLREFEMALAFKIPSGEKELYILGPREGNIEDDCPGLLADIAATLSGGGPRRRDDDTVPPSGRDSNAWLFSWNPTKFDWYDYADTVADCQNGYNYGSWTCANSNARKGDRFYMVRLGKCDHKGVFASGTVISDPYLDEHYETAEGYNANPMQYVDIRIEHAVDFDNEPILEMSWLKLNLPEQNWCPQQSGIRIRETCKDALYDTWEKILGLRSRQGNKL